MLPLPSSSSPPNAPRRIKFIWGSSSVINARWRLGLFGFYTRIHGFPDSGLAISLRGLLAWLVLFGLAGYVAGAAAVAHWLARNPYNHIDYADVITWPVRREAVARLRGRAWLAEGDDALKAKRWSEGVFLLRRGLEACPDDFDARENLAQFYLASKQRPRAMELLADGPLHGLPPPAWRERVLAIVASGEDWPTALLICDRCLAQLGDAAPWSERQRMIAHKLEALIGLGQADAAVALAEAEGDRASWPVKVQRVRALFVLGRPGDAADFLARWRAAVPVDLQPEIVRLQAQAWREAHRFDDLERALADLRALNPGRPEPLAFGVEQRARAGLGASAALDEFIFRFGSKPADFMLVAKPLAVIPDVALVRQVRAAAVERGFPLWQFQVELAEALLRQGDWAGLAAAIAALPPLSPHPEPGAHVWLEWIQLLSAALSSSATGDQDGLVTFMRSRLLPLEAYRLTVSALQRAGRLTTAQTVLALARRNYPGSPDLRAREVDLGRALAAPPPAPAGAPVAAPAPTNVSGFFGQLDAAMAAQDWPEAERLIASVRHARPPPAWLEAHTAELLWRELHTTQHRHDALEFRATASLYLNGSLERAADVLAWARQLHAAGEADAAVLLVKAVLEKSPDHPLATSLLNEWRPRVKPATP